MVGRRSAARADRGEVLEARVGERRGPRRAASHGIAGRVHPRPVAQDAGEELSAQPASLAAMRSARGDWAEAAEEELADDKAGALREQLHRRLGMGDARRPVLGDDDRARHVVPAAPASPPRRWAKSRHSSVAGACTSDDVAARRGLGWRARRKARVEPLASTKRTPGRARRGRRRATTAARRTPRGRPSPSRRRSPRAPRLDDEARAPRSAKAVLRRSSSTPPQATCGLETTGMKRALAPANIRRRPAAWSMREEGRSWRRVWRGVRAVRRDGGEEAALPGAVAKTRFISAASRRQAALPPPRSAAARARATRVDASPPARAGRWRRRRR